jgi:hypothetical protein
MTPFTVRHKITNEPMDVPCGKCPACYKRRVSEWSFRLTQEGRCSTSSHFITLTYDTQHVPITAKGYMNLCKRDTELFFKRLRKLNVNKLKYYIVGEYGGKSDRPHYHIILFNADIKTIQMAWQLGSVHYGQVSGASIGYTLKYMSKTSKIPKHANDDRIPQFGRMSKGLGGNYLSNSMVQWHKADKNNRMYCNLQDGKKIGMPRYYKNKIYEEVERKAIGVAVRQKVLKEKEKAMQDPLYYRNKFFSDKQAFTKMQRDANKASII